MISLGVRAHDFGKLPVDRLAEAISAHGLGCIQLALAKAIDGINSDTGALNPGLAAHVRERLARRGIRVAVLGCYVNLVHPDLDERGRLLARFKEHLRFARDFGCSVVATETASLNADWSPHPGNRSEEAFETALRSVSELVEVAEKFGVFVAIEGVAHHVMHSPRRLRRMLDLIASPNLQILLDPVNLLDASNFQDQERILQESFELLGDRIIVTHAKDFVVEDGRFRSVASGFGSFNTALFMRLLAQRKSWIDVLLEDTSPSTIARSIATLRP